MKICTILPCTGLLFGALACAQSNPGTLSKAMPTAGDLRSVSGCLSRTNGKYVITGGGPGPKQFRVVGGDTSALKGKLGHSVKVTGVVGTNDAAENMVTPYNEGSTTGVGYNTIVVQKVQVIYANCSDAGSESRGDAK